MAETKKPKPIVITGHQLGWVTDYSSANLPIDGADGQYKYSYGCSPVRPGKRGSVAPAEIFGGTNFSDVGNALNTLPRSMAVDVNFTNTRTATLCGGAATVAPRIVIADNTNTIGSNHPISAPAGNFTTLPTTGFWGEDICFYPSPNGAIATPGDFAYYTYNTSTGGYIGQYTYGSTSYLDDFINMNSVTLAPGSLPNSGGTNPCLLKAMPHRICVGSDRIMYITNGQYIASYDGTSDQTAATGTFNSYALDLGPGWVATDVQPQTGYSIAILAVKMGITYAGPSYATEARVIYWDGFSLDFNQIYSVDDWFGASLKEVEGVLFVFTQGLNGTTKAKYLNPQFGQFETAWEAPTNIVGNAPLPNQVEYFNNMILWNGDTTTSMIFGLMETQESWALHTPYYLSSGSGTVTKAGLLKNVDSNVLFAGVNSGGFTNSGLMGLFGDGSSNNSIIETLANGKLQFRTKVEYIGYKQTISKIIAYFYQFDSGSSMYLSLLPNKKVYSEDVSGNPNGDVLAWTINTTNHPNIGTTLTASTSELGKDIIGTDISNFWMILRFTNSSKSATPPILDRLEIYPEPTEKP